LNFRTVLNLSSILYEIVECALQEIAEEQNKNSSVIACSGFLDEGRRHPSTYIDKLYRDDHVYLKIYPDARVRWVAW